MKSVASLLASAALAVAIPSAAYAVQQQDTVDTSLPTQLPRTAVPHHYAITITPREDALTFDGTVAIDVEVTGPTTSLVLSAANLSFAKVALAGQGARADSESLDR